MRPVLLGLVLAACGGTSPWDGIGNGDLSSCSEQPVAGCPLPTCPDGAAVSHTREGKLDVATCTTAEGITHVAKCFEGKLVRRLEQRPAGPVSLEYFEHGRVTQRQEYSAPGVQSGVRSQRTDCDEWWLFGQPVHGSFTRAIPAHRPMLFRSARELEHYYTVHDPQFANAAAIDWDRFRVLALRSPPPDAGRGRHYAKRVNVYRRGALAMMALTWRQTCDNTGTPPPPEPLQEPRHTMPEHTMVILAPRAVDRVRLWTRRVRGMSYEECRMIP